MAFKDLKVGIKQGLGFGLILVVMTGVSVFAIVQMGALRQAIEDINQFWLERALVSARLNVNASALRTVQWQHALATNAAQRQVFADSMQTLIDEIYAGGDAYDELIEEVKAGPLFSEEEEQLSTDLEALWDEYLLHSTAFVDLRDREAVDFLDGAMGTIFDAFSTKLKRLVALNEASVEEAAGRAESTYRTTRNRIIVLLVITVLLSVGTAAALVRFVTVPVRGLVNAARKVADGDFSVHLGNPSRDEIGKLARSFDRMTQSLNTQQKALRTTNAELTEQKGELEQTLHRLRDTQAQLVLKEKMASLGQLTAGIAHEIKNPLNFVNNFSQLSVELADELVETLEQHREQPVGAVLGDVQEILRDLRFNAERIYEHGRRADGIVRGMLEHSRSGEGERRPTPVNALLDEYANLAYHGIRARQPNFNVTIERDYDEAVGEVSVVPQEMGRVLLNLLTNAFYAVHQKQLSDGAAYTPTVRMMTRKGNGTVQIAIGDNGPGIPQAVQEKIFEPFYTTKPTGSGNTGLGLSLSYEIVTQGHSGMLAVESEEGRGATFVITLPA